MLSFESKRCSYATFRSHSLSCVVVIFRDEFSTICQSFIVFVVREGVMICNLKTDSKSEFGCQNTVEERERCAGEAWWPKAMARLPRVEAVCHTTQPALWPCVAHAPHTGTGLKWPLLIGQNVPPSPSFKCLLFPPFPIT